MNNPQEFAKTFNLCCLSVAVTVIRRIKNYNSNFRDNVNPSNYLINKYNNTFLRINLNNAITYEIDKFNKPYRLDTQLGMMKSQ